MIIVALVAASFATQVVHLISTQGLLYGLGASLVYSPFTFYIDQWFVKRKGLAYGVFWAGTGFCGSLTPTLMEWAINNYGFRITLRAWALVLVSISPFHRGRDRMANVWGIPLVGLTFVVNLFRKATNSSAARKGCIVPGLRIPSNPFVLGISIWKPSPGLRKLHSGNILTTYASLTFMRNISPSFCLSDFIQCSHRTWACPNLPEPSAYLY